MTVTSAIDSMYEVFGLPGNSAAPLIMKRRIFSGLNEAMQILWSKGHRLLDFYTRSEGTVTFAPGADKMLLNASTQSVVGPVRRASDNVLLRPISTKGEYESFYSIYANSLTALVPAPPQAYFIEATRASGGDATALTMFVVPRPAVSTEIKYGASLTAPKFIETDYEDETEIPVPHDYAESILLPIARYLVSSSLFFADKAKQREPALKADYDRALATLVEAK
jgi:hypothetical protein